MKPSAKMTDTILLKAYGEQGRNNYEIALLTLSDQWLKDTLETTDLLQAVAVDFGSFSLTRKDNSARFLAYDEMTVPFYESWFGDKDLAFIDTDPKEMDNLFRIKEPLRSDALFVHCNGIALYKAYQEIEYTTATFDLFLIQEILTHKN